MSIVLNYNEKKLLKGPTKGLSDSFYLRQAQGPPGNVISILNLSATMVGEAPVVESEGSVVGALNLGAAIVGEVLMSGSSVGTLNTGAAMVGEVSMTGDAIGQLDLSAVLVGDAPVLAEAEGSVVGELSLSAAMVGEAPIVAAAEGSVVGPLSLSAAIVGEVLMSGDLVGALNTEGLMVGEMPIVAAAEGSTIGELSLSASMVGEVLFSGSAIWELDLDATLVGETTVLEMMEGSVISTLDLSGTLVGEAPVLAIPEGSAISELSLLAAIVGEVLMSGSSVGTLNTGATLVGEVTMKGDSIGDLSLSATLVGDAPVLAIPEGSTIGELSLSAAMVGEVLMTGDAIGQLDLSATLVGDAPVLAIPEGFAISELSLSAAMVGEVTTKGDSIGDLSLSATLVGEAPVLAIPEGDFLGDLSLSATLVGEEPVVTIPEGDFLGDLSLSATLVGETVMSGSAVGPLNLEAVIVGQIPAGDMSGDIDGLLNLDVTMDGRSFSVKEISFIGAASADTTTVSLPAGTLAGDFAVVVASRNNTGGPGTAAGWDLLAVQGAGTGGNVHGQVAASKILTAADITAGNVGTWTQANQIGVAIYRGGEAVGGNSSTGANGTTVTFPARSGLDSGSWVVAVGSGRNTGDIKDRALTGFTNRTSAATSVNIGIWDTNAVVASTSEETVTVSGSSGNAGRTLEMQPVVVLRGQFEAALNLDSNIVGINHEGSMVADLNLSAIMSSPLPYQILVKTDNAGTSTDVQFTLPATGTYDVDWGDGTEETLSGAQTHTYATAGNYVIKVTGGLTRIAFINGGDRLKLLEVQNWGTGTWSTFLGAYYGCSNCQFVATDALVLPAHCANAFRSCPAFNQSVANFNTTAVTGTFFMFSGCTAFNQSVANFNTAAVTDMEYTFSGCTAFNQSVANFNTAKVTNMSRMFESCTSFKQSLEDFSLAGLNATVRLANFASATNINAASTTTNYDATLIAWEAQLPLDFAFTPNFGTAQYSAGAAATARADLVTAGWTITDGGQA